MNGNTHANVTHDATGKKGYDKKMNATNKNHRCHSRLSQMKPYIPRTFYFKGEREWYGASAQGDLTW